jgi:hypothetical protein
VSVAIFVLEGLREGIGMDRFGWAGLGRGFRRVVGGMLLLLYDGGKNKIQCTDGLIAGS